MVTIDAKTVGVVVCICGIDSDRPQENQEGKNNTNNKIGEMGSWTQKKNQAQMKFIFDNDWENEDNTPYSSTYPFWYLA